MSSDLLLVPGVLDVPTDPDPSLYRRLLRDARRSRRTPVVLGHRATDLAGDRPRRRTADADRPDGGPRCRRCGGRARGLVARVPAVGVPLPRTVRGGVPAEPLVRCRLVAPLLDGRCCRGSRRRGRRAQILASGGRFGKPAKIECAPGTPRGRGLIGQFSWFTFDAELHHEEPERVIDSLAIRRGFPIVFELPEELVVQEPLDLIDLLFGEVGPARQPLIQLR